MSVGPKTSTGLKRPTYLSTAPDGPLPEATPTESDRRIMSDLVGFGRIRSDSAGFGRIFMLVNSVTWSNSVGFGRTQSDLVGFGQIQ